jgi:hypothetical protein
MNDQPLPEQRQSSQTIKMRVVSIIVTTKARAA